MKPALQPHIIPEAPRKTSANDWILTGILLLPIVGVAGWLVYASIRGGDCANVRSFAAVSLWFDPLFFQYNILLGALAIAIVPVVPFLYVNQMAGRKRARLSREIPAEFWGQVAPRLDQWSTFRFYFGSVLITTTMVALGISILLFMKPIRDASQCGVDFSRGANLLMSGPFAADFGSTQAENFEKFYQHLLNSLVGFQFGFLGAYIYFLMSLARSYFLLDLTPESLIDGAIRMAVASAPSHS